MTQMPFEIPDFIYYTGMTFGEMVEAGFTWSDGWEDEVYSLTAAAKSFYGPRALALTLLECYDLVPGTDRPDAFRRNIRREFVKAFNHYGPILQTMYTGDIMQDGGDPESGAINIQSDGQVGFRQLDFLSDYPQSMLQKNVQDYGSQGKSVSHGTESNAGNLDAILKSLGTENTPSYNDALSLLVLEVEQSGIFSAFIY